MEGTYMTRKRKSRARAAVPAHQLKGTAMFGNERRLARIEGKLDLVLNLQRFFGRTEYQTMSAISDAVGNIKTKVAGLTTVVDGIGVTLATLAATNKAIAEQLAQSGDIPAAVASLNESATAIDSENAELQAAIVLHTPAAAETPVPDPVPLPVPPVV